MGCVIICVDKMSFEVASAAGLEKFNKFLLDNSYVSGWTPTQKDVDIFKAIKSSPDGKYGNVLRWWKSNIILDIKPWDDETPLSKMEESVRSVEMDGLLWGTSKFVAVGYGIKKLQITCVVEDDKVSTDDLEDKITAFEDYVQSMDIVAFNKI